MSTWEIEHDRTNVVCPDCAFSFDAIHQDETGGYTCPLCEPAPASGEPSGAEAVVREAAPFSDTAVARIIEAVEKHCGAAHQERDADARRLARRLANATPPSLDYPNGYTRLAERFHAILTDAAMAADTQTPNTEQEHAD